MKYNGLQWTAMHQFIHSWKTPRMYTMYTSSHPLHHAHIVPSDDEPAHADIASKRRATALLVFCDHALKRLRSTSVAQSEEERATSQELLISLLAVATAKQNDDSYSEVVAAASTSMASALGVMSATDFVAGILTMLQSGSTNVSSNMSCQYLLVSDSCYRHRAALYSCLRSVFQRLQRKHVAILHRQLSRSLMSFDNYSMGCKISPSYVQRCMHLQRSATRLHRERKGRSLLLPRSS